MNKIRISGDRDPAIGYTISRNDVGMFIYNIAINVLHPSHTETVLTLYEPDEVWLYDIRVRGWIWGPGLVEFIVLVSSFLQPLVN